MLQLLGLDLKWGVPLAAVRDYALLLQETGADPVSAHQMLDDGWSPLMVAADRGYTSLVVQLRQKDTLLLCVSCWKPVPMR